MRVIVCGGRYFSDKDGAYAALDRFHSLKKITCLIQGGATGADKIAKDWATDRGIEIVDEPAQWKTYGKAAGPIRNKLMIDKHMPDAVIAFPGDVGTADMKSKARAAGLKVYIPKE